MPTRADAVAAADRNPDVLALVQATPDAMVVLQNGRHVFANERALELYRARDLEHLASKPALEYMHPRLGRLPAQRLHSMQDERRRLEYVEEAIIRLDGTECEIEVAGSPIVFDGKPAALVVIRDITERKQVERARQAAEERFRAAFVHAPIGMAVIATDGQFREVNPALAEIFGSPMTELIGSFVFDWVHPDDRAGSKHRFQRLLTGESAVENAEVKVVRHDGGLVWAQASTSALRGADGTPASFILQLEDVSARHTAEEQLTFHASRDQLTGLANRRLFVEELEAALIASAGTAQPPAVLFVDLDRFKVVNDSMGHRCGDLLLAQVGARFRAAVRPSDVIARLGGDEFAVVLQRVPDVETATRAAQRLQRCLAEPFSVEGADVFVKASMGVALASEGSDALGLLRDADAAMFRAKASGGGHYVTFDERLRADFASRMDVENGLYSALNHDELFLVYQPIVETASGEITGVEALIRWRRSDGTIVPPDAFIPVAEETGAIVPIGLWVVEEACRQVRAWRAADPDLPPLTVAVNVSARQLLTAEFCELVAPLIDEIAPDRLTLEVTETATAEISDAALAALERLSDSGAQIAIDDFGTGQSSLARLRSLPVRVLKIDREFVSNITRSDGDRSVVLAILALAHALGLEVTAEGVETAEQLAVLREAGCQLAQGYLFDRPRAPAELTLRRPRPYNGFGGKRIHTTVAVVGPR